MNVNEVVEVQRIWWEVKGADEAIKVRIRGRGRIERGRHSFPPALQLQGIVLTMFDARNTLARQVVEQVREHFKEAAYKTVIPRNVALAEAPSYGRPAMW